MLLLLAGARSGLSSVGEPSGRRRAEGSERAREAFPRRDARNLAPAGWSAPSIRRYLDGAAARAAPSLSLNIQFTRKARAAAPPRRPPNSSSRQVFDTQQQHERALKHLTSADAQESLHVRPCSRWANTKRATLVERRLGRTQASGASGGRARPPSFPACCSCGRLGWPPRALQATKWSRTSGNKADKGACRRAADMLAWSENGCDFYSNLAPRCARPAASAAASSAARLGPICLGAHAAERASEPGAGREIDRFQCYTPRTCKPGPAAAAAATTNEIDWTLWAERAGTGAARGPRLVAVETN